MKKLINYIGILLVFLAFTSCEQDPVIRDNATTEINSDADLHSMMNGTYALMKHQYGYGRNYMLAVGEIRADNVFSDLNSGRWGNWMKMDVRYTNDHLQQVFSRLYQSLANPNIIINADLGELEGNEEDIEHLLGQAYGVRAYIYFDLLRGWGQQYIDEGENLGISYVKSYKSEEDKDGVPRGTVDENKQDILNDIDTAIEHLKAGASSKYADNSLNFTLDAAILLKARFYNYFREYDKVREMEADLQEVLQRHPVTAASEVVSYWAAQTPPKESIFELANSSSDNNGGSNIGNFYRGTTQSDIRVFTALDPNGDNDANFEAGDVRAQPAMIDYQISSSGKNQGLRYMGKYPDNVFGSDNIKLERGSEIALILAEAFVGNDDAKASQYLNEITANRNVSNYASPISYDDILEERRKELLGEGFRFFDLQRFGKKIRAMGSGSHPEIEPGDYRFTLPLPRQELDANKQTQQNPHY